MAILGV